MPKQPDHLDVETLIENLDQWNYGKGVSAEDWIGMMGKYELAIGYSLIFWPRFVLHRGYVLRQESFSEESLAGWEATGSDRRAIEAVINHVHIVDIHGSEPPPGEAHLRYLGRTLSEIHSVKLKAEFPDRTFVVEFNDEPGLDPVEYQFTFWQA